MMGSEQDAVHAWLDQISTLMKPTMLKTPALLLFALVSVRSFAQDELDNIPLKGYKVNDFVPAYWLIDKQIEGDLNKDSQPDMILQLIEKGPEEDRGSAERAVVVLLSEQGHYKRIGLNKKLLSCSECRGIAGYSYVKIKRNTLIISVGHGSNGDWGRTTFKFRYDPKTDRLVLIGEDGETNINQEYYKGSINYLTNIRISKQYRLDKDTLKLDSIDKDKVKKARIFFEGVKYYYNDD